MVEDNAAIKHVEDGKSDTEKRQEDGVGAGYVGPIGILFMGAYTAILSFFLLYSLLVFWPTPDAAGNAIPSVETITFFSLKLLITHDVRLLIIVSIGGALGSLAHVLRSLSWYVGNRDLVWSWLLRYVLLPFLGMTLALIFYFVVRAGFFSPAGPVEQTNPYHLAALAVLAGMFSDQVTEKLREVLETLLATKEGRIGKDHVEPVPEESVDKPEPESEESDSEVESKPNT